MNLSTISTVFVAMLLVTSFLGCLQPGAETGDSDDPDLEDDVDDPDEPANETDETDEGENASDGTTNETDESDGESDDPTDEDDRDESANETDSDDENVTATIHTSTGDVTVSLEVAATSDERAEGLMHRESLPENHGMVFVYPDEGNRSFWMKNTLIPLDIIYLDSAGSVVNIQEADPPNASDTDFESYPSDGPAQYVIELEQGFSAEHGVEPGTEVTFHDDLETYLDAE